MTARAFWLDPDWSGGDNMRDPGTSPFWMRPPLRLMVGNGRHIPLTRKGPPRSAPWGGDPLRSIVMAQPRRGPWSEPDHVCGPFVRLWTGYEFCKECEEPRE